MTIDPGMLDRLLADAVGADSGIAAELRALFLASATQHLAALSQADKRQPWRDEALRLQGLAASFGVNELMDLAARAAQSGPDPVLIEALADSIVGCRR